MVTVSQKWDKRVGQWHDHVTSAAAFGKVLDRILVLSQPQRSDVCVDLGAGTGFVTTALAPLVASVRAVDISPAMAEALAERAADAGLANVSTQVTDLKDTRLPPSHADLIVSSYALHHLPDADKRALTARAAQWLFGRPPGHRGHDVRPRREPALSAILRQKVAALAAKGIGGWWRIAKNLTRYGLRVGPSTRQRRSSGSRRYAMRDLPRCASIRSPPKPALSAASARHPRYGLMRAEGGREPGGLARGVQLDPSLAVLRAAAVDCAAAGDTVDSGCAAAPTPPHAPTAQAPASALAVRNVCLIMLPFIRRPASGCPSGSLTPRLLA